MNLELWQEYRHTVVHPTTAVKPNDIETARRNIEKHDWAKRLRDGLVDSADAVPATDSAYLERMIPRETPNSQLFTMCPVCEGAPVHGQYDWVPSEPDRLTCTTCKTVYPNPDYPEDFVIQTDFGGGQEITYYAGKSWDLIGFPFVSSWTANIRARKTSHMANLARKLATAYVLSGNVDYAAGTRDILVRFAQVYPGYMVHSGYGEFSDLDAVTASERINDLPGPELVIPPNKPDNKLHVGYWMAGRATGVGMEGTFLSAVAVAYDLTCEATSDGEAVYSADDRETIERDLLLEGTILLTADPGFNNKSATNRSAVGMVGLCLGEPNLVRFGLEGFRHFVRGWFLDDGMTSESPGYGYMTLGGISGFGDAVHGYSDPEGYKGPDGRLDNLDIYGDSAYRGVFAGYVNSRLPNGGYGVIADDSTSVRMSLDVADIIAARYPGPDHTALLTEIGNDDLETHGGEYALFHRNPEIAQAPEIAAAPGARIPLNDHFFPVLRIGLLRTGEIGRDSTALISASDWGGHHHEDSLNLTYCKDGHEALTDLGYLWDRPDKAMTVRTSAHNTVLVNGQSQRREGRGGNLHAFDSTSRVKVLDVSSSAYDEATEYARSAVVVDHGRGQSYLLDTFRVCGGGTHDYLIHGPREDGAVHDLVLDASADGWQDLANVAEGTSRAPWSMTFELDDASQFTAHALPDGRERVLIGDGWGERGTGSRDNVMTGETVPYVIRQRTGDPASSRFVSLFDVSRRSSPFVWEVRRISPLRGSGVAVCVTTAQGTDTIALSPTGEASVFETPGGTLELRGRVAVFSTGTDGEPAFAYLMGGPHASLDTHALDLVQPVLEGKVLDTRTTGADSYLLVDAPQLDPGTGDRQVLVEGASSTGFPILKVEAESGGRRRIYTKLDGCGYDAIQAHAWRILRSVTTSRLVPGANGS
jgi:hypothetical protein